MANTISAEPDHRAKRTLRAGLAGRSAFGSVNTSTAIGLVLVAVCVLAAALAPFIAQHDPLSGIQGTPLSPPSANHWFGTDESGRDIFARVVYGARYDILIAVAAGVIGTLVGTLIGAALGFYGGLPDELSMRAVDAIQAFPVFILAMGVVAAVGQSVLNLILVITFVQLAPYIRLVRAQTQAMKTADYVEVARTIGIGRPIILVRHVIPNVMTSALVQGSASTAYAILVVASLSFVGLGINPPTPEWGSMVNSGISSIITGQWWVPIFPGLAIVVAGLGFNLIGDGLQELLDPRRQP
jgi:peptide/nickel transport system permease protein